MITRWRVCAGVFLLSGNIRALSSANLQTYKQVFDTQANENEPSGCRSTDPESAVASPSVAETNSFDPDDSFFLYDPGLRSVAPGFFQDFHSTFIHLSARSEENV